VIALSTADAGQQILNTNADLVAAVAGAPEQKLLFVLKTPGLLANPDDARSLLPLVDLVQLDAPSQRRDPAACGQRSPPRAALTAGIPSIHLVSGLLPDAILAEVFTNEGSGTMIVAQRRTEAPVNARVAEVSGLDPECPGSEHRLRNSSPRFCRARALPCNRRRQSLVQIGEKPPHLLMIVIGYGAGVCGLGE
jgi:hypothetical protein